MIGLFLASSQMAEANDSPAKPVAFRADCQLHSGEEAIIMNKCIKTDIIRKVFIIQITSNKLVTSNTEDIKTSIDAHIEPHRDILIDMTHVEYIDSSGLGCLLHCLRKVNAAPGRLKIFGITRPILSLFELIHLDQVFDVHANLDAALQAFQSAKNPKANMS